MTTENPFAQLIAQGPQDTTAQEPTVTTPEAPVPATTNPFDLLREQVSQSTAEPEYDLDEAYAESLIDEVIGTTPEPEPEPEPAPEPTPEPEPVKKTRKPRKAPRPESAQAKPPAPADPVATEITSLVLSKPADQAWVELTEIIDHVSALSAARAALQEEVDEAKSAAADAIKHAEEAQRRRKKAEEALRKAQEEFDAADASFAELTAARDEVIEKGTRLFDEFDALTKEYEGLVDRAEQARTAREAVITFLTALTGGTSGTFGSVRVTFIDGTPHIEQATPAVTAPGEDNA